MNNVIGATFNEKERTTYWNTLVSLRELNAYPSNQTKCSDKDTYNYILKEYVSNG